MAEAQSPSWNLSKPSVVYTGPVRHITRQKGKEMNRIKGLALGLGSAALMVVGLACGTGEAQDPAEAGPASDSPQAEGQTGPSDSAGENTSPVISGGSPLVSLTYAGAVYYLTPLVTDEAAKLNEGNLELVGATTESNLIAPGSGKSLKIYKIKGGEQDYIYTLMDGGSFQIEDGHTITTETFEAEWMRWTTADSN